VRLVRDRAWLEGDAPDKLCAYRTLYEALDRVARLLAPVAPHISDMIYSDLEGPLPTVHMEDWPVAYAGRIDEALERDMAALRRILEASLNARNRAGVKLRWPLRRLVVSSSDEAVLQAAGRLMGLLKDQSNCKEGETVGGQWSGMKVSLAPQKKVIGPRYGKNASWVIDAITGMKDPAAIQDLLSGKSANVATKGGDFEIGPDMVLPEHSIPEGFIDCRFDGGVVYLDIRLDDELRSEGLAHDLVRRFQQMRKEAGLQVEDRIRAYASISAGQSRLLDRWKAMMMNEIRALELLVSDGPLQPLVELCAAPRAGSLVREWELDQGEKALLGIQRT
jgi:isoleucyl-tRNA synthetase